jgi:hypothetical protein
MMKIKILSLCLFEVVTPALVTSCGNKGVARETRLFCTFTAKSGFVPHSRVYIMAAEPSLFDVEVVSRVRHR